MYIDLYTHGICGYIHSYCSYVWCYVYDCAHCHPYLTMHVSHAPQLIVLDAKLWEELSEWFLFIVIYLFLSFIECNNQFVIVTYYSANTSFSCTFLNKSDSSPKSCSVMYGICGQEMSTIQGNAIEGSLFTIAIKLNSSIVRSTDCYIITASNGTYEIMLNGSISLPAMSERADNVLLSLIVIPVITVLVVGVIIIMVVGIILRRRQQHGNQLCLIYYVCILIAIGEYSTPFFQCPV